MAKQAKLGSGKRFASFTSKLRKEGYSKKSAGAIAASAGRKAHPKTFSKMAAAGRKRASRSK